MRSGGESHGELEKGHACGRGGFQGLGDERLPFRGQDQIYRPCPAGVEGNLRYGIAFRGKRMWMEGA